jgi:hypothetical protein
VLEIISTFAEPEELTREPAFRPQKFEERKKLLNVAQ